VRSFLTVYRYEMTIHPDTVKFPYHHGSLRAALMDAAEDILSEKGVENFSLREAARRAGVSPAAPAHHFVDKRGLLTAVATRAFDELCRTLSESAPEFPPAARVLCEAYVRFAADRPARFQLMWRASLLDQNNRAYRNAADRAFAILDRAVTRQERAIDLPGSPELVPSLTAWCLIHGFANLLLDDVFGNEPADLEHALNAVLPNVLDQAGFV
jgi:AcrR family transcriptional regulator